MDTVFLLCERDCDCLPAPAAPTESECSHRYRCFLLFIWFFIRIFYSLFDIRLDIGSHGLISHISTCNCDMCAC